MPLKAKHQSYFISAGEHSGDLLGADLVLALTEKLPGFLGFGITGDGMDGSGVERIAHIDEMSVMGISDVLKNLPKFRMLESRILTMIERRNPKFAILIDNPGFHLRLGEQLRLRGIKVFQYVAPKLWAWGEGRLGQVNRSFDHILGILPFEEDFFRSRQVPYIYVGSPVKDRIDKVVVNREVLGVPKGRSLIACLPGSRPAEIKMNLPLILGIRDLLLKDLPDAMFITPMASNLDEGVFADALGCQALEPWRQADQNIGSEYSFTRGLYLVRGMSLELMASADVAIVASGTATLECALLGTPMVVVYKMSDVTYQIAKRAVKLPYVSLANLMAGRRIVSEFIQEFSLIDAAKEVLKLLNDQDYRSEVLHACEDIRDRLDGAAASRAAEAICSMLPVPKANNLMRGMT